jgi:hypothetical protein
MMRALSALLLLCCVAACGLLDPHHPASIAGVYQLALVDDQVVPCCARTDSMSGVRTTPIAGELTLGAAPQESFGWGPAGVSMPESCVYSIPNGARLDADTVFRADGTWYLLPPCGRGAYTLTLT